jgi:hypothetical protein
MTDETLNTGVDEPLQDAAAPAENDEQQQDEVQLSEEERIEALAREKARKYAQKRIDRLTWEANEAKRKAEELEAKLRERQERQPEPSAARPKPEDFQDYDDYVEALADWKAEEKARKLRDELKAESEKTRAKTEADRRMEAFRAAESKFRATVQDYDEAIQDAQDTPMTQVMFDVILESEVGPNLLYHLAKNPDEAERIAHLSPARQAAEIGKLEDKLAQQLKDPQKPKASNAPPPVNPVRARGSASTPRLDDPNLSMEEYSRLRRKQLSERFR